MEIHPSCSSSSVLAMDHFPTNRAFQLNSSPGTQNFPIGSAVGPNNTNALITRSYNSSPSPAPGAVNIQHLSSQGYIGNGAAASAGDFSRPSDHHLHHQVLQSTAGADNNTRSVQLSVIPEHSACAATTDELNTVARSNSLRPQHVNHLDINDVNIYNDAGSPGSTANILQRSNSMEIGPNNLLSARFCTSNQGQSVGTALIRQSSSPAKLLSRVAMEECSAMARPAAQRFCNDSYIEAMVRGNISSNQHGTTINDHHHHHHHVSHAAAAPVQDQQLHFSNPNSSSFSRFGSASTDLDPHHHQETNGNNNLYNSNHMVNKSALFRQNSSPAGLLSQLSMSGYSSADQEDGGHDDQAFLDHHDNYIALRQSKRLREMGINCGAMLDGLNYSGAGVLATDAMSGFSLADTVLCRARAKRGCATHPRSIAERVRRTKISDRMRKLQELVPNMEKQTNIAAMLDEAIDYVKYLQQQVQELSDKQAQCNGKCHNATAIHD